MSRREARLSSELDGLSAALEVVESLAGETSARRSIDLIRGFLLPRLSDPPAPLVVAVMGSTGAGKSTLVNSIAGAHVSKPGVLRPTTDEPVVWTSSTHARFPWPGTVVTGDHPLAEEVALIDTPDLDSNVIEHRQRAVESLAVSDAVVFVTTSSRYGDASAWEVLRSVDKPLVVVINRLQTRASGARNDLVSRLRADGIGAVGVLTISEQRVDPVAGRLSRQSVQRLAVVIREWAARAPELRRRGVEAVAGELATDLTGLIRRLEEQSARSQRARKEVEAAYEAGLHEVGVLAGSRGKRKRWPWPRPWRVVEASAGVLYELVDRAALEAAAALERAGLDVSADLRTSAPTTVEELSKAMTSWSRPDLYAIAGVLAEDRRRFFDRLPPLPDDLLDRLHRGTAVVADLEARSSGRDF